MNCQLAQDFWQLFFFDKWPHAGTPAAAVRTALPASPAGNAGLCSLYRMRHGLQNRLKCVKLLPAAVSLRRISRSLSLSNLRKVYGRNCGGYIPNDYIPTCDVRSVVIPIYSPNCTLGVVWGWIISGPAFMLESMPLKSLTLMAGHLEERSAFCHKLNYCSMVYRGWSGHNI